MAAVGMSGAVVAVSPRFASEDCQASTSSSTVSLFFGQKCQGFVLLSGRARRRRKRSSGSASARWAYATDSHRENLDSNHSRGRTLYDLLGVSQLATPEQIRTAYRSKALKVHPDVVPEDEREEATKAFLELKRAYAVLHDRQQRAAYDLKLRFRERGPISTTPSQWGFISVPPSADDPSGTITYRGRKHFESDFFS